MVTARHPNADTEVLRRVREAIGPGVPLVATLDFHANCDPRMAEYADALVGYQTYPHVDQRQRGLVAAELLARTVRGEIKPVSHIAKRPMIANILGQATDREPMKGLMAPARGAERRPGVLSVSVMGGFQYADVPCMGPSVIAVADGDRDLARSIAEELADRMWDVRERPSRRVRRAGGGGAAGEGGPARAGRAGGPGGQHRRRIGRRRDRAARGDARPGRGLGGRGALRPGRGARVSKAAGNRVPIRATGRRRRRSPARRPR